MTGHIHWGRFIGKLHEICSLGERRHLAVIVIEETDDQDTARQDDGPYLLARTAYEKLLRRLVTAAVAGPDSQYDEMTLKTLDIVFGYKGQ